VVIVVQETLDRLKSSSGVLAVILADLDGAILYTASDMDIAPPLVRGMIRIAMGRVLNNLSECA
jgi:hypothetical protein